MVDLDSSGLEKSVRRTATEHVTFSPVRQLYARAGLYVPAVAAAATMAAAVSSSRGMRVSHHWAFLLACVVGEVPGRFRDYLAYREDLQR